MGCPAEGCSNSSTTGSEECIKHKFAGGRMRVTGLHRFKHDRELGMTQMEKAREQYEGARQDGRDITRVPGMRTPHEKRVAPGKWEKV